MSETGRVFTPVTHRKPPLHPHPFEPSGVFRMFGDRMERCAWCGLIQRNTRWHPEIAPTTPSPTSTKETP